MTKKPSTSKKKPAKKPATKKASGTTRPDVNERAKGMFDAIIRRTES